jgi:hypothetical protein
MGSLAWRVLGTGSALLAASVMRKALTTAWRTATGDDPPTIPEDPETDWAEAIGWAALSGALIGLARLAAKRQAARYYQHSTGHLPPGVIRDT